MALENITQSTKELKNKVETIATDNLNYYKLLGFKTITKSAAGFIKVFVVGLACLLIALFLSLAGGFALAEYWDNNAYGFLAMAGIIFLLLLLFLALKRYIVDKPILRNFSEIFNDD